MKKARLYLAIFAYVILIKRLVNQTLRHAFYLYRRGDRLIQRFKSAIIRFKKKRQSSKPSKPIYTFHLNRSILIQELSKGYQIQILRI